MPDVGDGAVNGQLPPAGWHPDPKGAAQLRYWDGRSWTEHVAPHPELSPTAPGPAVPPAQGQSPPPAWHPDPKDPRQLRYWDGAAWTDHVAANPEAKTPPSAQAPSEGSTRIEESAPTGPLQTPPAAESSATTTPIAGRGFPEPPAKNRTGIFGSKKNLESELEELRKVVDDFGYAEREALSAEIERLRKEQAGLAAQVAQERAALQTESSALIKVRDDLILQEVGVYDYKHQLEDSISYKSQIATVRDQIKAMSRNDGGAVTSATNWTVEGSAAKGRKMVTEFSKLLLRAYNGEADTLVSKLKPYKLATATDRLDKSKATITRLGQTMAISITDEYHRLRIRELELTADYLARKEEEKEAERAEKERLREEAKARREFEAEKARLLKEQSHYARALEQIRKTGTPEEVAAAEATLHEIEEAIHGVEDREANIRAGYVYIISNVGAFGPGVVKIGMTRRLEPMDRVKELGDASVPFRYDVHAIVFSDDAVSLEGRLHEVFADRRVNRVNLRREFFYAAPVEVEAALTRADGSVLEFVEEAEAEEFHQSENERRRAGISVQVPAPGEPPPVSLA